MIHGIVTPNLEATVRIHIEDSAGQTQAIDLIIDTGFSAFISLPIATVAALGLTKTTQEFTELADGNVVLVNVHSGVVVWDGQTRRVDVHALGKHNMIGMRMLAGHDVAIRVRDGSSVSITLIP